MQTTTGPGRYDGHRRVWTKFVLPCGHCILPDLYFCTVPEELTVI